MGDSWNAEAADADGQMVRIVDRDLRRASGLDSARKAEADVADHARAGARGWEAGPSLGPILTPSSSSGAFGQLISVELAANFSVDAPQVQCMYKTLDRA